MRISSYTYICLIVGKVTQNREEYKKNFLFYCRDAISSSSVGWKSYTKSRGIQKDELLSKAKNLFFFIAEMPNLLQPQDGKVTQFAYNANVFCWEKTKNTLFIFRAYASKFCLK